MAAWPPAGRAGSASVRTPERPAASSAAERAWLPRRPRHRKHPRCACPRGTQSRVPAAAGLRPPHGSAHGPTAAVRVEMVKVLTLTKSCSKPKQAAYESKPWKSTFHLPCWMPYRHIRARRECSGSNLGDWSRFCQYNVQARCSGPRPFPRGRARRIASAT